MIARALLWCALGSAACARSVDPCAGVAGTCLALDVSAVMPGAKVDRLQVDVTSPANLSGNFETTPASGAVVTLPAAVGLLLGDLGAPTLTLSLKLEADDGGSAVACGQLDAPVMNGARNRAAVTLGACGTPCTDNTQTDVNNCGACGHVCARVANGVAACKAGVCVVAGCTDPFHDCDGQYDNGCEANLASDANNCNGCGNKCASGLCGKTITLAGAFPWQANSVASFDPSLKTAVLTTATANQAGAVVYRNALVLPANNPLSVTFSFTINAVPNVTPGDGVAFFLESNGPGYLGTSGGGLGMARSDGDGIGIELDLVQNAGCPDAAANHAAIESITACGTEQIATHMSSAVVPPLVGDHQATIEIMNGSATLILDGGAPILLPLPSSFNPATPYHFAFSAATGTTHYAQHTLRNLQINFATPRCL